MAETSFPHAELIEGVPDEGSIATEDRHRQYFAPMLGDGVIRGVGGELALRAATSGGLAVELLTGEAQVRAHRYVNDTVTRINLSPADATRARFDRVVARLIVENGRGRVRHVYVPGVPGAAGPRPLVRTATAWDVDLGAFPVPAAAGVLPAFGLRADRFARPDPLEHLEPLAEFRHLEMEVPEAVDTQVRIPTTGGVFIGFDVNRFGSGPAGSYVTVRRDGVYDVGLGWRYTRTAGAPDLEVAGFVEAFRGVGGNRLARIGNTGPPNRDLYAAGQMILRAGDLIVWTVYRSASSGSFEWRLTDEFDTLRATARLVRDYNASLLPA